MKKEILTNLLKTLIDYLGIKFVDECLREAWIQKQKEETDRRFGR